jgi:hypothetical protein
MAADIRLWPADIDRVGECPLSGVKRTSGFKTSRPLLTQNERYRLMRRGRRAQRSARRGEMDVRIASTFANWRSIAAGR